MAQQRSAAFYLFKSWYGWRVPAYAIITDYARTQHGLFLPEDKKKANAILLDRTTIFRSAADMAEYVSTGSPLDINDPMDGLKVYGHIMQHMADWLVAIDKPQLIVRPIPMEGLRQFNALANKLFPVANRYGYFRKPEVTMSHALQSLFGESAKPVQEKHRFNDTLIRRLEGIARRHGGRHV